MREYCSGQVAVECLGAVKLSVWRDQPIIHAARWLNVPRKSLHKKASHELFHAALELLDIVVAEVQWAFIFDACVCVEQPEFL